MGLTDEGLHVRLGSGVETSVRDAVIGCLPTANWAPAAPVARKPLATLAIDSEIRFASAADRAAFTAELPAAVTALAAKYHDEHANRGRWHRVVVAAHASPCTTPTSTRRPDHG